MAAPPLGFPRAPEAVPPHATRALAITSLGVLLAFVNASIVIISLPAIFRGLHLDPLRPGNVGYLLWMITGYLVVTSVLVVAAGRLGDLVGRARVYTAGFGLFTLGALLCAVDPASGGTGALLLIGFRCLQGVGGAALMANSTAILVDAFPAHRRGVAIGINQVTAIAGSFAGLLIGGLLADSGWRLVFFVSVPPGIAGTLWAWKSLRDNGLRRRVSLDLLGNITFAVGLVAILVAITYGIQPAGGHQNGWQSPFVLGSFAVGVGGLLAFTLIEARAESPMFDLRLFQIRAFTAGNLAGLFASAARGGLQFALILWLQGIWLPLHGYSFASTPLWAGIYLLPLTVGFLIAGPVSGHLSDRFGARPFATAGMLLTAVSFALLLLLPINFDYRAFAALLVVNGLATGLFTSPNTTSIMNCVPASERGIASGMRATFQNSGQVLSIGLFFGLIATGLSLTLPNALQSGLVAHGVPVAAASHAASGPAIGPLFAAFLGDNPVANLLGPATLHALPAGQAQVITGKAFFPQVLSGPFHEGLLLAFGAAILLCLLAAGASYLRGTDDRALDEVVGSLPASPALMETAR
ncbi:MAG TPA: MFS transporter [Mycobacteriales bacterium]|nr:MFS transporter [Mycobacteriales bacterium]